MAEFFEDIFKYRPRKDNKSINTFLGDLKTHPEVLAKRLTDLEKEEADKLITTEELKETLDNSNTGKTPGPDGAEKEFLTRFWPMIGKTINDATQIFIRHQKMNVFLETAPQTNSKQSKSIPVRQKHWRNSNGHN